MDVCLKNNPAEFHPDPIWDDGALGYFKERRLNIKSKISIVTGSVPDPKSGKLFTI